MNTGVADPDWAELDPAGIVARLQPGLRAIVRRRIGAQYREDVVQDTIVDLLAALHGGALRNVQAVPGFARTIAVRKCAAYVQHISSDRSRYAELHECSIPSQTKTEADLLHSERIELMQRALARLSASDREILHRFYVQEQSPQEICAAMHLTSTQYRLRKSRAKAKFGQFGSARQTA